ncbi:complex I NDUFA9 subunit family protein [Candidatus Pelagibacter sp.]|nr:complex I NDUFA9 subunit family protein [Candidatus Pelagibacter sp.]
MKPKNCLIFGASGQVGRHLLRKLTKNNYKVTAVTRNLHQKGYLLKTQASAGWIDCVETNIFDEEKLKELISKSDICINLVGILYEDKKINTFENIHVKFPSLISKICKDQNIRQFIHLSALGIDSAKDSIYAKSKIEGETIIKNNFPLATFLRPSVVYSVDDNFTTSFMSLLSKLPIFPLYYNGETKFVPISADDLSEIILKIIDDDIKSKTIECIGPEIISLKEILQRLLKLIDKKKLLLPMPLPIAKLTAKFFQLFPKPLITEDQLKLLSYDNIPSGNFKTNFDIGAPSIKSFDEEVEKYCYMYKEAGQFSTKKYN